MRKPMKKSYLHESHNHIPDFKKIDFDETLYEIRQFLNQDCSTSQWFAQAYICWYRSGESRLSLGDVSSLDPENFWLFCKMLRLRNIPRWSNSKLFELEQHAKAMLKSAN
jgi:hypothetical protein